MKRNYKILKWYLVGIFFLFVSQSASQVSPGITYLYSFSKGLYSPLRIATDDAGTIYVTDAHGVSIVDTLGNVIRQIENVPQPLGIAVDNQRRIYIGDQSTNSVSIFTSEGVYLGKLGLGDGQFTMPTDITVDLQGKIYVVDSGENCVKVFNPDGSYAFQFGDKDEKLTFPTGIVIDELNNEILVGQYGGSAKIHIFDMAGRWKSSFGRYGQGQEEFTNVQGLAVDDLGRIYVTDTFQSVIQVVDRRGNFLTYVGGFGTEPGLLRIPLDVCIDGNNRLLITSMNNKRVEVFEIVKDIVAAADNSTEQRTIFGGNALLQNYPNPFNPDTWIPYRLKEDSYVTIRIYDALGRLTRTIDIGPKPQGMYTTPEEAAHWDGRDDHGKAVCSGVYFCEIYTKDFISFRKIMLLK